ncbi:DUF4625 domain-containing protein [Algibacter lectus]|uniref:DUF4625 domain-containing protein n=1 Tax=Algibacter lectus TaxID=221126 RepID=UPI0026F3197A|nr:DUF4625 domain-containing protein [Algibacter lectus]MDO7136557.1 DUF4625 domain-containing protein [Algibacter lectus]
MKTTIMKTNFKVLAVTAIFGLLLNSCSSDDTETLDAPVISSFEYGEGSTHSTDLVAYKGSDIHLEAVISAEAVVSGITLSIHAHDLTPGEDEVDWDFEQVFTDANYLVINPTFHEHVDIPNNIPVGEYHVELTVVDTQGNSTEIEGDLQILDSITISEASIDSTVVRGNDFHVEFMIDAVNGIHNITVDFHADGVTVGEGEVEWDYEEEFLDGYHEETEIEFHEHFDVPATAPAGEYHLSFVVEDEEGNTKTYESHIDITVE